MACSPTGSSQKRVCVGDCFDVDERGKLQIKFAESMGHLFTCTDDGLCYSHQYPVCADTFTTQTGCGADTQPVTNFGDCFRDGFNFIGAGNRFEAVSPVFSAAHPSVNDASCSPTLDDDVNPTVSTNQLELVNDSCTPWKVEIQTDQFYGFIDDFQPFRAGYARILGEVRWGVDENFIDEWQRVYELARSGNAGANIQDTCTDCCNDLPEDDGDGGNPRQNCIDSANANREQAEAVVRLIQFADRLNTTGGAYRTTQVIQPGETLTVETRARISATCDQNPIIGARAGHISVVAWPFVGCSDNSACDDCNCGNCS